MRYENVQLKKFEFSDSVGRIGNFEVGSTNELVQIANTIRSRCGYTDLVTVNNYIKVRFNYEVYYNFYFTINFTDFSCSLIFVCHNGKEDDYKEYTINLSKQQETSFLIKAMRNLYSEANDKLKQEIIFEMAVLPLQPEEERMTSMYKIIEWLANE